MTVKRSRTLITVGLFSTLFVFSQDYWRWSDPVTLWLFGLPRWMFLFVGLQFAISGVVLWYGREGSIPEDDR